MDKVKVISEFILEELKGRANKHIPLFVGVQGPQGCGKSFLANKLPSYMAQVYDVKVAAFSLDDVYLRHADQERVNSKYASNRLLQGRGQPGTHDLELAHSCFEALKQNTGEISLPTYNKALFDGKGDRSTETVTVTGPVHVVIFEGWMTGFFPIGADAVKRVHSEGTYSREYGLEELLTLDTLLKDYVPLWNELNCFVQLSPQDLDYVWTWRLQQEHDMKLKNGGKGMSDEQVTAFIKRYMPGYELFLDTVTGTPEAVWSKHGLRVVLDKNRDAISQTRF